ncbi:MAG: DNA mismatch repair endonuclease MutL [Bacteroidetes bacterium]|jgi:DNA mismatch repair protein MutL|nr:DNA mismatch repair endonuclease MutL [Bacteroidota bacterium]MBX7238163.1 DNA mismatch repair endonuclease MutL [Bacteroidia bacterium]MCW5920256.1 DNA mismatch repair endonuclease MutL [Bacteroidota bacterium]HMU77845.1 DNA mismatch repair endonuclease MutL [Bacteroidia bacterium]HMW10568.1 DNA mismatch repair endonuclease MutL [Bacteroidia bacterium]
MADVIQLLSDTVANQIAAGEVILRPSSVIKELMENAVDAGATRIDVSINDGGKNLIRITDNGCGMSETDARLCFERYATSKLRKADDLYAIRTMGFRGEAMASVAAVCQVELKTKREADETGTRIEIEGSEFKLQEPCVMQSGTIITVKNIFFNVPARRNFLKATPVEARHVMDEFLRVALPRPEIGFSLQHNGMEVYNLPATHQRQRICQIFGAAYNERLVPVEEDTTILNIKGFVGKPEFAKKVRGEQYFFINKRFVKDAYLNHAVTIAFNELLPQGTFASYFLFFEVDPSRIDVNIHPTKTEVKLEDEKSVYAILRSSVKRALGRFSIAPTLDFNQEQAFNVPLSQLNTIPVQPQVKVNTNYNPFKSVEINKPTQQQNGQWEKLYEIAGLTDVQQTKLPIAPVEENSASAFMQLFNSYIAVAMQDELWLIDQQLAHEKIVFEKTLLQMKGTPTVMQQSLFPLQIELDNRQNATISSLLEDLNHSGFDLQPFGQNTFVLNAVPSYLETGTEKKIIEMLIDEFISGEASAYNPMERVAIAIARSACLKRGKVLSAREMSVLFNDLMQCEMPYFTKSGKAIIFKLEKNEIDRKFEKG